MTEQRRKAPDRPAAERSYAEYVRLPAAEGSVEATCEVQRQDAERAQRPKELLDRRQA